MSISSPPLIWLSGLNQHTVSIMCAAASLHFHTDRVEKSFLCPFNPAETERDTEGPQGFRWLTLFGQRRMVHEKELHTDKTQNSQHGSLNIFTDGLENEKVKIVWVGRKRDIRTRVQFWFYLLYNVNCLMEKVWVYSREVNGTPPPLR